MNKNELLKRIVPGVCLVAYFVKMMFLPATLTDAFVLLILSSLIGFLEWWLDQAQNNKQLEHLKLLEQKIEDLDKKVATVKLTQGFSNIAGTRKL